MNKPVISIGEFETIIKSVMTKINEENGTDYVVGPDAIEHLVGTVKSNFNINVMQKPKTLAGIVVPDEIGINDPSALVDTVVKNVSKRIEKCILGGNMLGVTKEYNEEEDEDWTPGDE